MNPELLSEQPHLKHALLYTSSIIPIKSKLDSDTPFISPSLLFLDTFSLAHCTVSTDTSVAIKLHPLRQVPSKGYIQEVPVPIMSK